jgi:N6-L-threonylcarbamoyladenine synthase
VEVILPVIEEALKQANLEWDNIDAIAVTQGPGLLGSLLIGVLTARTLAIANNKPLYAVNHVEAHPYACFITEVSPALSGKFELPKSAPKFPILALTVSGGHTQLVLFEDHFKRKIIGQTVDDAVGEAFDKVAKMLGLPYPGGPSIGKFSQKGNPNTYKFPTAHMPGYDFSFSGLKTAVLRAAQEVSGHDYTFPSTEVAKELKFAQKTDLAASFQKTAIETLVKHLKRAENQLNPRCVILSGGVAANQALRQAAQTLKTPVYYPDIKLCTDNAAMIAALG